MQTPIATPIVIHVLNQTGNLMATAVVDYEHLQDVEARIRELCAIRGYVYKSIVPHTPQGLVSWLER